MTIETTTKDLKTAMATANRVKPRVVEIVAASDGVVIRAASEFGDYRVAAPVVGATTVRPMTAVVNRLSLGRALRAAPSGPIVIGPTEKGLQIATDIGDFYTNLGDSELLPEETAFKPEWSVGLPVAEMVQVAGFASLDDSRPILTTMQLKVENGEARFAATDSFRLMKTTAAVPKKTKAREVLIPARAIQTAARIFHGDVTFSVVDDIGWFTAGDSLGSLSVKLIAGGYPTIDSLWPTKFNHDIEVDEKELVRVLHACAKLASNSPVVLKGEKGKLVVEIFDQGSKLFSTALDFEGNMVPMPIAFNPLFLMEAVKVAGGRVRMIDTLKPVVIGDTNLIMPVRTT